MSRDSAHEHVADRPVTGGGHELLAARDRPYRPNVRNIGRFRWVIVALFVFAAGSLAAAVVLTSSDRRQSTPGSTASVAWSSWRPVDSGLAGAQEIADYVAPYYRATPASQLAVVTVVNLNNPAAPVQVVVPTSTTGSVLPLAAGSTIVYNLCGEGSANCSIGVGKPSANRLLLLRREALELALYTFEYVGAAQTVVATLPPGYTVQRGGQKSVTKPLDIALAFDRRELSYWLNHPLRATLPESIPPTVSQMGKSKEAELVSVLTAHGMFSETTQSAQDGSSVITLTGPLRPQ
ncbi:MAG TPA: hypothetical protein VGI50_11750 [Solirubrobacteraceae bacterium]|jgi:hypothetical protein